MPRSVATQAVSINYFIDTPDAVLAVLRQTIAHRFPNTPLAVGVCEKSLVRISFSFSRNICERDQNL